MLARILIFAAILLAFGLPGTAAADGVLTVAWVENGDLMVWTQGDSAPAKVASDGVHVAFLAPDGKHIAYTRGGDNQSSSLWTANRDGQSEKQLISAEILAGKVIADVRWLDATTLYFNTAQATGVGQARQDDLWRADSTTGQAAMILPPGKGGNFTFSPDGKQIALVRPGVYDGQDGQISLVNPLGEAEQDLLSFPAISTGSEYQFYPLVFWLADSSALQAAIPDRDLIYNDSTEQTALWRLGTDGSQDQTGTIQASFFGQPHWSFDGQFVVFLRRAGDITANQFELVTAAGNGENTATYATGEAGMLQLNGWLPGATQFVYAQGQPGTYWLGDPGQPPQPLPGSIFTPRFVTASLYVYTMVNEDKTFELRLADLNDPAVSTLITRTDAPIPVFDAVFTS